MVACGADATQAEAQLAAAGLAYPIVAKPDIGWQGYGVRRVDDAARLRDYLAAFPREASVMLQRVVPFAHDAAVLYARGPGAPRGRVISLTSRVMPFLTGDGVANLRMLIQRDARALEGGSAFRARSDPSQRSCRNSTTAGSIFASPLSSRCSPERSSQSSRSRASAARRSMSGTRMPVRETCRRLFGQQH